MWWFAMALLAASVTALITIFDKTITGYARSRLTPPLLIGFSQTSVGVMILLIVGVPASKRSVCHSESTQR